MKRFWPCIALLFFAWSAWAQETATLRVGLWTLWHDREISVGAASSDAAMRTCEHCAALSLTHDLKLRAEGNAIAYGDRHATELWLSGALALEAHSEKIAVPYSVHMTAHSGVLTMAVTMPVERYVERVVASESGAGDSAESRKALAIAVRSFALHVRHGHTDYDLCDATHCQLLHWRVTGREAAAHTATLATAGETLWFHGQRAAAWFHQNCGGHTAAPADVWGAKGATAPWLVGRADPYCTARGIRDWSSTLTLDEVKRALASQGLVAPGWKTLVVTRRNESGRAVTLTANTTAISAEDFRLAVGRTLGWNRVPSAWFELSRSGDGFLFHGRGTGHGVGLCQAGAAAMAAQGLDAQAILGHYFSGAEIRDESSGLAWKSMARSPISLESLNPSDAAFLPAIESARANASVRSGIPNRTWVTVRTFRSTPEFRAATLAPGWVAAFTEGSWIGVQPLRILAARHVLNSTLRHEFLHVLVEQEAGPKAPLWLREGLVEVWSEETPSTTDAPKMSLDEVNRKLARAANEIEAEAAHKAARWYTEQALTRYGRAQVMVWLRSGVPAQAVTH